MLISMTSFEDNLGKVVPECQTILQFAPADDAGGDGGIDNQIL